MATLGLSDAEREAIDRFQRDVIEPSMTKLVVLDFWAEWCGPCKQLGPVLDKVAADYADRGVVLAKIDVDHDKLIAAQFRIQSIPTVYALFQGQPVADLTAYRTEAQLARVLDQLLAQLPVKGDAQDRAAAIEPSIVEAEALLDSGATAQAIELFRALHAREPDHPAVVGGLARALIAAGHADEARAVLDQSSDERHPAISRARAALEVAGTGATADRADLESRIAADPGDHDARFALAEAAMAAGDRDRAADALLAIIAADKDWEEGKARQRLLTLLEATGLEDPWARAQRRRLSAALFT